MSVDKLQTELKRRIGKVGRYHLWLFLLPALSLLYYGWLKAPSLNERPDNPQRIAPVHLKGRILDRTGAPLAHSVGAKRRYPTGASTGSLIGYQLPGRNKTGLEASLQHELSPPLPPAGLMAAIREDQELQKGVRRKLHGPDLSLTLDAALQSEIYQALQPNPGAVVVADSAGRILAAVSSPSYHPELVRQEWQKLRTDPSKPFIERVGSGLYPVTLPGSQVSLLGEEKSEEHPWFKASPFPAFPDASRAVWLEDRLLVSPLMLLEYAYFLGGRDPLPVPGILSEAPTMRAPSDTMEPPVAGEPEQQDFQTWPLDGPPFRDSPEFLVRLGKIGDDLVFAVVLERADESSKQVLEQNLLPLLRKLSEKVSTTREL